jgi:hypothetical protein
VDSSFDHLVGAGEDRLWNGEAEGSGGFEVENQLEFGRLFNRQFRRLGSLQDFVDIRGRAPPDR